MSGPCSLPLSINLRHWAQQAQSGSSLLCHSTSTTGALSLPSCSATLHQCWIALLHTFANSSPILSHTLVHIPPFSLPGFLDHSLLLLLSPAPPLAIRPSGFCYLKGWSVAGGQTHAHTNICTARHHQEEMQRCIPLPLSTVLHNKNFNSSCRRWSYENLFLCRLTLLNVIYCQLHLAHKAKCTRARSRPQTTATVVYIQPIPHMLFPCQEYSIQHYVCSIPLLQLHPYLSNLLFLGMTDLYKSKKKKKHGTPENMKKHFKLAFRHQSKAGLLSLGFLLI